MANACYTTLGDGASAALPLCERSMPSMQDQFALSSPSTLRLGSRREPAQHRTEEKAQREAGGRGDEAGTEGKTARGWPAAGRPGRADDGGGAAWARSAMGPVEGPRRRGEVG